MVDPSSREPLDRAVQYSQRYGAEFKAQLGAGYDGIVLSTHSQSAMKALRYEPLYVRERDVYLRLLELAVVKLAGFKVPRLIRFDDDLWVIEMEFVSPPFVVDFAGAYLDEKPDFPHEVLAAWEAEKREQFEDNWPAVRRLVVAFGRYGIYLADVKPGNIVFAEPPEA